MKKLEKKKLRDQFKKEERAILDILNEWDFIPFSPDDEYDCLAHKIISALHKTSLNKDETAELITLELREHFCLEEEPEIIDEVAGKIERCWRSIQTGISTSLFLCVGKGDAVQDWKNAPADEIVCYCMNINKAPIVQAVKSGCDTLEKIKNTTTACTGNRCKELNPSGRCCADDIRQLIDIFSE